MTALSATVGTGNIAGVATAIALGGPGAIFYMWVIALFGMATKYAEAVCAVKYREVDKDGKYVGGPMYYLRSGVGEFAPELGKWLGLAFAIFGAVAAFGIGNAVQVGRYGKVPHKHLDFMLLLFALGNVENDGNNGLRALVGCILQAHLYGVGGAVFPGVNGLKVQLGFLPGFQGHNQLLHFFW